MGIETHYICNVCGERVIKREGNLYDEVGVLLRGMKGWAKVILYIFPIPSTGEGVLEGHRIEHRKSGYICSETCLGIWVEEREE